MNKYFVQLHVLSIKLCSNEITQIIGFEPDKTWKIGDFRAKTIIKEERNGWMVESQLSEEAPLEAHVENLLARLQPVASKLLYLSNETEVQFSCVVYSTSSPPLFFEKNTIAQISALGASFDIDVYIIPEE